MSALLAVVLATAAMGQVDTSSTATIAQPAPQEPPPVGPPKPEVDRLGELPLYVGVPLLLPDPPPQPAPPPPPPAIQPVPPPEPPVAQPAAAPPRPVVEEERKPPPWSIPDAPWIERLRSLDATLTLMAVAVLMVLASLLSSFVRRHADGRTLLPRLAAGSNKVLRVLIAVILFLLVIAWLPSDALPFALLAAALALGWSLRDVLPDLIAGSVLAFERRVRPGMWLSGNGFAGVVERVGLRATWLRDPTDRRVAVPNRALVSMPITSDAGRWPTREVVLRIESTAPADKIRRAIIDAVLASPWTPVGEAPSVQRDGAEPEVWHVRSRVLDLSFAGSFEGELLERAEAMLVHQAAKKPSAAPAK